MSVCVGPYGGQKKALEFPDDEVTDGYELLTCVLGPKLGREPRTLPSFVCFFWGGVCLVLFCF